MKILYEIFPNYGIQCTLFQTACTCKLYLCSVFMCVDKMCRKSANMVDMCYIYVQSSSPLQLLFALSIICKYLLLSVGKTLIGGVFPVEGLVLFVGVSVAIVVAFTSTNDKPPVYHCVSIYIASLGHPA